MLFPEDSQFGVRLFCGGDLTDEAYHQAYPTIHHLILDLMNSREPRDIRLVYMACAWLIGHRGHFLLDLDGDKIDSLLDFHQIYEDFIAYLQSLEYPLPWPERVQPEQVLEILQQPTKVKEKKARFRKEILEGNGEGERKRKAEQSSDEALPYVPEQLADLLTGNTVSVAALFPDTESELKVSLTAEEEVFAQVQESLSQEQADLLTYLRRMFDCAKLLITMPPQKDDTERCISAAKIETYNQHKRDLAYLKQFIRTYHPDKYAEIFRRVSKENYVSYSRHVGSLKKAGIPAKFWVNKDAFSAYLQKIVKDTKVSQEDLPAYQDMLTRLELRSFLPKQRESDNRIIPQQLYRMELDRILERAKAYLPFLTVRDADGISVAEKIQSIFSFRVPYFVGPLNAKSPYAWIVRKGEEKILPWNFEKQVNLDASEQAFINRMTNRCTYLPGEDVVPEKSLLYGRFTVLNELNNLKVDGREIPVEVKQQIFSELFVKERRVTPAKIKKFLLSEGLIDKDSQLSGLDETVKSSLQGYHVFRNLLTSRKLTEAQAEDIIHHCAYSEDKKRLIHWLELAYPNLSKEDRVYISKQNLKGFGRLPAKFLTQLQGGLQNGSEEKSILEWMWDTNENLMQLLSERYTFNRAIREAARCYYDDPKNRSSLEKRMKEDYRLPGNVRRGIYRTLDIVGDVVRVAGVPQKIFVEMARGGTPEQKGKRTSSRKKQLMELYSRIKTEEARRLQQQLEDMGEMADNRLQSVPLFLYYLQMGKCAYTGNPINLGELTTGKCNKEHIYPQSYVKDDSVLNNLVLVESEVNGAKSNIYPISQEIRTRQRSFWEQLVKLGLMTQEKFRRLTRSTPFSDDEKQGFINRQLVETRQSTKVVAELLKERYPNTEIVYVKAGIVSEFRQELGIVKCRTVNDLHHAKDAYLNIVVGNVYHERFNKQWFRMTEKYNVQVKTIMKNRWQRGDTVYWNGAADVAKVKAVAAKNAVHLNRYAFCKNGKMFNLEPVKPGKNLVQIGKGLPTEKYGGYSDPAVSFYILAAFTQKKKRDLMLVPVELRIAEKFVQDPEFAKNYARDKIYEIKTGKSAAFLDLKSPNEGVTNVQFLLKGRKIKINTVLSFDGFRMTISAKSNGGERIVVAPMTPLILGGKWDEYVKKIDSFCEKRRKNGGTVPDEHFDKISIEKNME